MFGPDDLRSTLYIQRTPVDRLGTIDAKPRSLGFIGLGWNGIFYRLVLAEYESSAEPDQIQRAYIDRFKAEGLHALPGRKIGDGRRVVRWGRDAADDEPIEITILGERLPRVSAIQLER